MMLSERMLRTGYFLRKNKNIFPYLFALSMAVAIVITRPSNLMPLSFIVKLICAIIAGIAVVTRFLAMRTDGERMPDFIKARGIYSVMRHPIYASNFMMVFALSLYLGILWYLVFISFVSVLITERIVFQKENCQSNKYGEDFKLWCKSTSAVIPDMLNWQSGVGHKDIFFSIRKVSGFVLASSFLFMAVGVTKHYVLNHTFGISYGWTAIFVLALSGFVFIRKKT